jgi:hypothetical protein
LNICHYSLNSKANQDSKFREIKPTTLFGGLGGGLLGAPSGGLGSSGFGGGGLFNQPEFKH